MPTYPAPTPPSVTAYVRVGYIVGTGSGRRACHLRACTGRARAGTPPPRARGRRALMGRPAPAAHALVRWCLQDEPPLFVQKEKAGPQRMSTRRAKAQGEGWFGGAHDREACDGGEHSKHQTGLTHKRFASIALAKLRIVVILLFGGFRIEGGETAAARGGSGCVWGEYLAAGASAQGLGAAAGAPHAHLWRRRGDRHRLDRSIDKDKGVPSQGASRTPGRHFIGPPSRQSR